MSQPYVGEIRMGGWNFAPAGWMFCEGQLLPISEFETLFVLIGTTYGGDGQSTFALPDLRGRVPMHSGNGFVQAETGGVETVTLSVSQIPAHSHPVLGTTNAATSNNTANGYYGVAQGFLPYSDSVSNAAMNAAMITSVGGNQPHDNMQPYLCISFIISLFGIFPSQT